MKKILMLLLTVLILINSLSVICYAAEESFVTRAINAVKMKIDIPENYTEFNSKLTVESGGHYAYFTWSGDDEEENLGGQLNVTVDNKLRIIDFSRYFYGKFNGDYKISRYNSSDAKEEAKQFLEKACPEFYPYTRLVEQEYSVHRNFEPYQFKFVRYENNLPCYDNYIDVTVDSANGTVSAFSVKWIDYDKIYSYNTNLSPTDASVKMYDQIGMVKEYAKKDNGEIYVRYSDLSDGVNYINGYTGNIVNTNYVSHGSYKNALTSEKEFNFGYSEIPFDMEAPLNVVANNEFIPLPSSYVLTGIQYLYDDYGNYLYMFFDDFQGNVKIYIVDTDKNDIRYYDFYQKRIGTENYNYNEKQCEAIAGEFVLNYNKSFIYQCKLLNYNNQKNYNGEDIYYFNYTRFIMDTAYDNNGVIVGVSRSTGEVVSVRSGWDNIDVPLNGAYISQGEAFENYINASGFELQYVTAQPLTKDLELRAVYATNPLYDYYVDAKTGDVIDENGKPINKPKREYTDISKDIAEEQIKTLLACGILDAAEKFEPNENILLCDYLLWMCRAIDCVEYKNIDEVADKLIQKGIVSFEELIQNQPLNTETGIKYIITYLGYGDVARLPSTFTTGFIDEGRISQDMLGYAAIARGLKIFQGNVFNPKEYIKRNVAAQILHNLISN